MIRSLLPLFKKIGLVEVLFSKTNTGEGLMPKISIIIPVYKVEKYLSRCLDSILAQTYQDWEAICVNDGSPDKCKKILAEYAQKDNRNKVITQKNQGISIARNNALKQVKGVYVCFLDSDDELEPTFLEEPYKAITKENADMAVCGFHQGTEKINCPKTKQHTVI